MRLWLGLWVLAVITPAHAELSWQWSYSGVGVKASGTFVTDDNPVADGGHESYYRITAITGTRNGDRITGLTPTGKPIPLNEPYAVDNLVSGSGVHLSMHGFGYAYAHGGVTSYANPFQASESSSLQNGYYEFMSSPDANSARTQEEQVDFTASPVR